MCTAPPKFRRAILHSVQARAEPRHAPVARLHLLPPHQLDTRPGHGHLNRDGFEVLLLALHPALMMRVNLLMPPASHAYDSVHPEDIIGSSKELHRVGS